MKGLKTINSQNPTCLLRHSPHPEFPEHAKLSTLDCGRCSPRCTSPRPCHEFSKLSRSWVPCHRMNWAEVCHCWSSWKTWVQKEVHWSHQWWWQVGPEQRWSKDFLGRFIKIYLFLGGRYDHMKPYRLRYQFSISWEERIRVNWQ